MLAYVFTQIGFPVDGSTYLKEIIKIVLEIFDW